jgi:hypothetical protein
MKSKDYSGVSYSFPKRIHKNKKDVVVHGSIPAVHSSKNRIFGFPMNAIRTLNFLFIPPLNSRANFLTVSFQRDVCEKEHFSLKKWKIDV